MKNVLFGKISTTNNVTHYYVLPYRPFPKKKICETLLLASLYLSVSFVFVWNTSAPNKKFS
jgi:hypothetical protein